MTDSAFVCDHRHIQAEHVFVRNVLGDLYIINNAFCAAAVLWNTLTFRNLLWAVTSNCPLVIYFKRNDVMAGNAACSFSDLNNKSSILKPTLHPTTPHCTTFR